MTEENHRQLLFTLNNNLNDTIDYLNCCSPDSFYWISELFEDLSEHFKSQELIDCIKRNVIRTGVDCKCDIEYAEKALL